MWLSNTFSISINNLKLKEVLVSWADGLYIPGVVLSFCNSVKNLGLHLESDLTWNKQTTELSKKVHGSLHNLRVGAYSLPTNTKLLLINSLILPLIDYVSPAFSDISEALNTKINKMLNSALRFAFNLRRNQHITPYRRQAEWLTAKNRRLYFSLSYFFSIKLTHKPPYLYNLIPSIPLHLRRTGRHIPDLYPLLEKPTTASLTKSFLYINIQYFNHLPIYIKTSPTLEIFKNRLFNYLFSIDPETIAL